ncbi:hypothetical protein [Bacillus sp. SJS]|uniref:hypothetical protein n=1 Tax=Bacillus sp. SJS TaxID=1423321 RepID=UPI0004DD8A02|nr:hypothetical protein [Bacillus sp. SJS]KZZ83821.1 hypothetical protein AS29_013785 [Bacillus sp. SJS]
MISLIVLFIAFMIIAAAGMAIFISKKEQQKGELDMTFRNLYVYLVLFATLMMSIGGSVGVFMSAADYLSAPSYQQSYTDFKAMKEGNPKEKATDEEIRAQYEDALQFEKERTRANALNGIIKSLGWIVIPLPVFLYFQRQVRLSKKD